MKNAKCKQTLGFIQIAEAFSVFPSLPACAFRVSMDQIYLIAARSVSAVARSPN